MKGYRLQNTRAGMTNYRTGPYQITSDRIEQHWTMSANETS